TGMDERGRVEFLDHRRPLEPDTGAEVVAEEDWRLEPPFVGEEDEAPLRRLRGRVAGWRGKRRHRDESLHRHVQLRELAVVLAHRIAVERFVLGMEALDERRNRTVVDLSLRQRNLLLVVLAEVAHLDASPDLQAAVVALAANLADGVGDQPRERIAKLCALRGRGRQRACPAPIDLRRGGHDAECRRQPRMQRDEDSLYAEALAELAGMERPRAAEREEVEATVVETPIDGDEADRVRHVLVRHTHDRKRGGLDGRVEPPGDPRDRLRGELDVERHPATEEEARVEAPEHDVRVGDGRIGPAAAVRGGAGVATGALGADAQESAAVEAGDRAAACADRRHVDERADDRNGPVDVVALGEGDAAVLDDAYVRACPTHVERDQVWALERLAVMAAGEQAAGEAGED